LSDNDRRPAAVVSVDLGVGAKIEGRIPERSLGRTLDALVDLIRPWTESRGLKADMIRLQREDVALEIAARAHRKISPGEGDARPPIKLLLPILESSSLEELDDEIMIDSWATLLASSVSEGKVVPRFVSILRDLNSNQAKTLEYVATRNLENYDHKSIALFDTGFSVRENEIEEDLFEFFKEDRKIDEVFEYIEKLLDRPTVVIDEIIYINRNDFYTYADTRDPEELIREIDVDILQSMGLVQRVIIHHPVSFEEDVRIYYWYLTDLGVQFVACVSQKIKDILKNDKNFSSSEAIDESIE